MKCAKCGVDSLYPARQASGGKCTACGQTFAFEPRTGAKLSDTLFKGAIDRVSSDGQVWWGLEHLRHELARRGRSRSNAGRISFGVVGVLFVTFALLGGAYFFALIFTIVFSMLAWKAGAPKFEIDRDTFDRMWKRWIEVHSAPPRLITRREIPAPKKTLDPDMAQYSFDRVVICDRARTVDLLLANNFHFENNCAVLGSGGYPQHVFQTVLDMLKNNPRLDVYVLHDATPSGCALAHRVAKDPDWFGGRFKVMDVGIRPAHAMKHRESWEMQGGPVPERAALAALTAAERAWLDKGWTMELATIRPEQVIKRLYRAIAEDRPMFAADSGGSGGEVVYFDSTSLGSEASASDGGGDSFG